MKFAVTCGAAAHIAAERVNVLPLVEITVIRHAKPPTARAVEASV